MLFKNNSKLLNKQAEIIDLFSKIFTKYWYGLKFTRNLQDIDMVGNLQEIYKILIWLEIYKKFTGYWNGLKFTRNLQDIDMVGNLQEIYKISI